jgi:hypothetical protein
VERQRIEAAIADAMRGDFAALLQLRPAIGESPWAASLDALSWLAGMPGAQRPRPEMLTAAPEAARHVALSCALSFDRDGLDALSRFAHPLVSAWQRIAHGEPRGLAHALVELERDAARRGDAAEVIDAAALRALAHAGEGALDDALEHARRASRMARTESLPQSEYLANVVLARIRRLTGRPHLAARILSALRRFAPAPWHPWIGWELAMAAGQSAAEVCALEGLAAWLHRLLESAAHGNGPRLGEAAAALAQSRWWPIERDAQDALAAIGVETRAAPTLERWLAGIERDPPLGLGGLVGAQGSIAWVHASPDGRVRRLLSLGVPLCAPTIARLAESSRAFARTDGIVAALAFAGAEGMPIPALFREVWGFKYSPSVHQGVFDTALHRARSRIAEHGDIDRREALLSLRLHHPLLLPDPRCEAPAEERVLAFLARRGRASAQEAAQALGIPLRSAQASLKLLVGDGACSQSREGRHIAYAVEDTTFQEPTLHGR